jgi:hypothetical protein
MLGMPKNGHPLKLRMPPATHHRRQSFQLEVFLTTKNTQQKNRQTVTIIQCFSGSAVIE